VLPAKGKFLKAAAAVVADMLYIVYYLLNETDSFSTYLLCNVESIFPARAPNPSVFVEAHLILGVLWIPIISRITIGRTLSRRYDRIFSARRK